MSPEREAIAARWTPSAASIAGSTAWRATNEPPPITPKPTLLNAASPSSIDRELSRGRRRWRATSSCELDEGAALGTRPVGGFEHGDHVTRLLGSDGERFAEQEVVGEVAVESPARV